MITSSKILYIGAGLHFNPLKQFESTKEFIFVDIQPRSEFDSPDSFYEGFYRKNFYSELIKLANEYGFKLEKSKELDQEYFINIFDFSQKNKYINNMMEIFPNICPTLLIFFNSNTGQKLKYYISTNILYNMCFDLENDIRSSKGLIISGYHPDKIILDFISDPINLYCYDETCYKINNEDVDDLNNLVYWMFNNLDIIKKYFLNIYLVRKENGIITKYDDIIQLNNSLENKI